MLSKSGTLEVHVFITTESVSSYTYCRRSEKKLTCHRLEKSLRYSKWDVLSREQIMKKEMKVCIQIVPVADHGTAVTVLCALATYKMSAK